MSSKLLLLFLPALINARINISIKASNTIEKSSIQTFGTDTEIVNDKEREVFRITDGILKTGVDKLSGGRPSHIFVKSPTPWNDLYQTYNWDQVKRTLKASNTEVLSSKVKPVTVFYQEFANNSSATVKYNGVLTQNVNNIISSVWTKSDQLYVNEKIMYSVDMAFGIIDGSTRVVYSAPWGKDHIETKNITIGALSGVELVVIPGKTVLATLTASKVTMQVEVQYTASLSGDVACNYPRAYKGHHFWAYDINDVLTANSLPKTVDSKEVITVIFYTDAKLTFTDVASHQVVEKPVVIRTR